MDVNSVKEQYLLKFNENVDEIKKILVNRVKETADIFILLGMTPMEEPAPAIFIHGDSGVGKTILVKSCLKIGKFCHAYINCIQAYSMKLVYEKILNQLAGYVMKAETSFQPYDKCYNFYDFVLGLRMLSDKFNVGKRDDRSFAIIIVLDRAEELRKLDRNVLTSFLKLREITCMKITVVLISVLPWSGFYLNDNALQPVIYFIQHYYKSELQKILMLDRPEDFSVNFYQNYLKLFLDLFYHTSHDVRELRYQAYKLFKNYSEPIVRGELTEDNGAELYNRCQNEFKDTFNSLYLKIDYNVASLASVINHSYVNLDLTYFSKYILVASYIASHNPVKKDKDIFIKRKYMVENPTNKKKKKNEGGEKCDIKGPSPFDLARLLAIVSAILDKTKFTLNSNFLIEIGSLVRMNLIIQITDDPLDCPKYKCNVDRNFIDSISLTINFPISKFLTD